jgi:magnesium transporter
MSRRQRPKVDVYSEDEGAGYLFAVLHFPVYDKAISRLNAGELDAFLGPDYLVTLPTVELRPVSLLFRRCVESEELRHTMFARGSGRLFYEVLDDLYDYCFPILDKIGYKLEQIDEDIDDVGVRARDLVRDIHKVKQEIISYRKIIKPQRPTLRQLERSVERFLPEDLELYFDDIVDASERIWDLLDNYKEVVEALEDTNESLISHEQNDILYVLTIFIVVLTPLTFLTGLFGMNVHFPGINGSNDFYVAIGLMVVTIVGMLGFFHWKRWL